MPKSHSANTRSWKSPARRKERREEAAERQENWASLSLEQQLQALDQRGHTATKQRAKIAQRIQARDSAPQPKKKEKPKGKPRRRARQEKKS